MPWEYKRRIWEQNSGMKWFYCLVGVEWPLHNQANKVSYCSKVPNWGTQWTTACTDKMNLQRSLSPSRVCLCSSTTKNKKQNKKNQQKPLQPRSKENMGIVVLMLWYDDRNVFGERGLKLQCNCLTLAFYLQRCGGEAACHLVETTAAT